MSVAARNITDPSTNARECCWDRKSQGCHLPRRSLSRTSKVNAWETCRRPHHHTVTAPTKSLHWTIMGINAALHLPDEQHLKHHCGVGGQWVVDAGKVKQHFLLTHSTLYLDSTARGYSVSTVERHCGPLVSNRGSRPSSNVSELVRSFARLAVHQEPALLAMKQDVAWVMFLHPRGPKKGCQCSLRWRRSGGRLRRSHSSSTS